MSSNADRDRARKQILKMLGWSADASFPRCPCRSESMVERLRSAGDFRHCERDDHVCQECQCGKAAGSGTDHFGFGPCHIHAKKMNRNTELYMTERHRDALMKPNPGVYADVGRFAKQVQRQADKAEQRISLLDEIQIARGQVQELIEFAQKDGGSRLTEYVQGEERTMSDATRMKLMASILPKVAQLTQSEKDLQLENAIGMDYFEVWFARLWSELQSLSQELAAGKYETVEGIQKAFKDMLRRIGDPRKHTGKK